MSNTPYMPLWVGDFTMKTQDLDAKEAGAYILLLMAMWSRDGTLPNDSKKLQRVARVGRDWPKVWASIQHYFEVKDGKIFNARLTEELHKANTKRKVNAQAGARGGRAKALKNNNVVLANASNSLKQSKSYSDKSKTNTEVEDSKKAAIFDPRDKFASGDFVFDEGRWFTENEIVFLEDKYPKIDVRTKLADEKFRHWAFMADSHNPLVPARRWFEKQARIAEAESALVGHYTASKDMTFNNPSHLADLLEKKRSG